MAQQSSNITNQKNFLRLLDRVAELDTHILWLFARKGEGLSIRALNLIESDRSDRCLRLDCTHRAA